MKRGRKTSRMQHPERLGERVLNPFLHQAHHRGSDAYMIGHPAPHGSRRARDGFPRER